MLTKFNDSPNKCFIPLPIYTSIFNKNLDLLSKEKILDDRRISPVRSIWVEQKFINIDLRERNLSHDNFFDVTFSQVSFKNANLTGAIFINRKFSAISFKGVNLSSARLSYASLIGAEFHSSSSSKFERKG